MNPLVLTLLLIGGGILVAYVLVIYGLRDAFTSGQDVNSRLAAYATIPDETPRSAALRRKSGLVRWRLRLNTMMSNFTSEKLALQLTSANWPITETEYLLIRFWAAGISFVLGWLISRSFLGGIGLGVIAYLVPSLLLLRSIQSRRTAFERQLVDVLMLSTGAVRAGYSLPQALDVVSKEMKPPASEEFRRVRHEIGLGLSLSQALSNLVSRMENDDLYLVVTAININSQVGGNLVTMLQAVTSTIRERVRLFAEARALTAQQRFGSYLLSLMPIGLAGALFFINPNYMMRLFEPQIICIPIGAGISIILGNILIRKLATIDI